MTGNPKRSPWYSTPRTARKRRGIEITLSDEAREKLDRIAPRGRRSEVIERLIMQAEEGER